jgi:2-polyprenyl-3-methyl-5-hydroxy-6-metoxy-1,4-benzoquinol methylase
VGLATSAKELVRNVKPLRSTYRRLWFFFHSRSRRRDAWRVAYNKLSGPPDRGAADPRWENPFAALRKKWTSVPTDFAEVQVPRLLELSDPELIHFWEKTRETALTGEHFSWRGWYHLLYEPLVRGARTVDFGSGLGMDGLSFASSAAHVTFVDVAVENLALLKRIAALKNLTNVQFVLLESFDSFRALGNGYDVILASGSLHHAPQKVIRREIQELASRLKIGGRWLQLAYPRARWKLDGQPPFSEWGRFTDGQGTPWAEWYDKDKLLAMFEPMKFEAVLAFDFHDKDFNWFDLVRRS